MEKKKAVASLLMRSQKYAMLKQQLAVSAQWSGCYSAAAARIRCSDEHGRQCTGDHGLADAAYRLPFRVRQSRAAAERNQHLISVLWMVPAAVSWVPLSKLKSTASAAHFYIGDRRHGTTMCFLKCPQGFPVFSKVKLQSAISYHLSST